MKRKRVLVALLLLAGSGFATYSCKKESKGLPTASQESPSPEKVAEIHNILCKKYVERQRVVRNKVAEDGIVTYTESREMINFFADELIDMGYDSTRIFTEVNALDQLAIQKGIFKKPIGKTDGEVEINLNDDISLLAAEQLNEQGSISTQLFNDLKQLIDSSNAEQLNKTSLFGASGTKSIIADGVGAAYGLLLGGFGSIVYGTLFSVIVNENEGLYLCSGCPVPNTSKTDAVIKKIQTTSYPVQDQAKVQTVTQVYQASKTFWTSPK